MSVLTVATWGAGVRTMDIIQNPVWRTGSARRIWPLGYGSVGWLAVARRTGVVLLAWIGVLIVYAALTFITLLWIGWAVCTLRRRHFVYDLRRYGHPIGDPR